MSGQQQITVCRYEYGRYLFMLLCVCVQVCLGTACVSLDDRGNIMCMSWFVHNGALG